MTDQTTAKAAEKMGGGKAVVEALKHEGVDTVFGVISIHMLPIYDALRAEPSIRLVIPRHEMSGGFMADAYNRVSGKPGVYLSSTGPGAANTMGAVIESRGAGSHTLQITSQIQTYYRGKGMLHEVRDQSGMFNSTGAESVCIQKTEEIAPAIHEAFRRMKSGRPTPQVIEIPIDKQYGQAETRLGGEAPAALPQPDSAVLDQAAELLTKAKSPAIWIGGGVLNANAGAELRRLAEALGAPVFTTRGGRGVIPEDHPLVIGNYFGERPARVYLQAADCVIALGTRFSWHSTNEWAVSLTKNLIRVDIEASELQHNFPAALAIHADAKPTLAGLAARIESAGHKPNPESLKAIAELKETVRAELRTHRPLTAALMDAIDANSPRERILVTDATIPAYWGGNQYLPVCSERGFVTPRLAAIGPGYPMALGAQAAFPDRPVICIAGDGGFMFHIGELATAAQEKLNVVLMVFNNQSYGVLKKLQMSMMGGRIFGVDLHTPDFVKVAEGMGVAGEIAKTPEELGAAVKRGLANRAPCLIDVQAPFEM